MAASEYSFSSSQTLTAGADDVGADLGNQGHIRFYGLIDDDVDFVEVFMEVLFEIRQIFKHGG